MRFFEEVEVSEVCMPFEAAEWIVRGKPPTTYLTDDWVEARGDLSAWLDGFVFDADPLSEAELHSYAPHVDYRDYVEMMHRLDNPSAPALDREAIIAGWRATAIHNAKGDPSKLEQMAAEAERRIGQSIPDWDEADRRLAAEATEMHDALSDYFDLQEQARTQVLAAIAAGKIEAKGYWAESMEGLEDAFDSSDRELKPTVIPPAEFIPSRFSWKESSLQTRATPGGNRKPGAYFLITLKTRDVLSAFPADKGDVRELLVFNGIAALSDGVWLTPSALARPTRGRPPKADWLRQGVRDWYSAQKAAGRLSDKREANVSAAMQWAEDAGRGVSRSTMQGYLKGLL